MDREAERLWTEYLGAEKVRVRGTMLEALERFIDCLLELPVEEWQVWAKELARSVSDEGMETPVRFPLFRRVLLPALVEGVLREERGCARGLASFPSLLAHVSDPRLPLKLRSEAGLLREAVRLDSGDDVARRRLVEGDASYFEYTLHELPSGVLYGTDGATAEQCDELVQLVNEFKEHVSVLGMSDRFAGLVRECEFHYRAYAEYLRGKRTPYGYEKFLEARGGGR